MSPVLVLLLLVGVAAVVAGFIASTAPAFVRLASALAGVLLALVTFGVLP